MRYTRLFFFRTSLLPAFLLLASVHMFGQTPTPAFRDSRKDLNSRVNDLLHQLTVEEKIHLLGYNNQGVPRLGVPVYNWWNEALHGVARAGEATVFPQAIGMAASFNDSLQRAMADAISTEARAKYNLAVQQDRHIQYMGLTFWSPNINLFRDPRWGRGQETYGEDPYLTARMGTAFVRGLQGSSSQYLKASACAKHFAVHSGPEANRHTFNARVDEKDLRETYLYAFHALVDAGVESVMCAYNRVNDEPCCTGNTLLQKILRDEWKFKGHVVTDCGALDDIYLRHKTMPDAAHVAAAAVKAGVNIDCSGLLQKDLEKALQQKLVTESDIDNALIPALRTQFKLGFYDAPNQVPYTSLGSESISNAAHTALARRAAQQSMVLLKNDKNILPLPKNKYNSIMILGPNAASLDALLANYHGVSGDVSTFVEGITQAAGPAVTVQYDMGCNDVDSVHFGGLWHAEGSDISIAVLGLTPVLEGEEGDAFLAANGGDRVDLSIPASHIAFLKALRKRHKKPIIAVVTAGSAVDIATLEPYADAIILAWYPGAQGGHALADVLFGKVSPSGRLPVTFYKSFKDLPAYDDYNVKGRTYRYFAGKVQYPFGYGLSYTSFDYSWKQKPAATYQSKDTVAMTVHLKNTGKQGGAEVVQAYIQYPAGDRMPLKELKQFSRAYVAQNGENDVTLKIPVADLQKWNLKKGEWEITPGTYTVVIGGHSADERLRQSFTVKKK
ncbi:glycoside hydrolase family 3 protein [Parachryseolinea silvisoli]|uniref:glycoside hydrolase family 3 protein n=1 Tax=Parachryseolinea silvisoli TaxID=2873601 RepID=UPI002265D402|nr:glycoside hydrolase family 3 protein [Parachryseolinea silvisoli]MCD9014298.1 glycoside hydrolase family 3 C-terminal domain-containing protein [Parachryseolinea silvisoli]